MKRSRFIMFTLVVITSLFMVGSKTLDSYLSGVDVKIVKLHEECLYPVVRVIAGSAGGSGTIIYSEDRDIKDVYDTYVLTNHHVVESLITVGKQWSPVLQANVDTESRKTAKVEVFRYEKLSKVVGRESFDADIITYSDNKVGHDLAILKLRCGRKFNNVAKLRKRNMADKLFLFEGSLVVSCTLGHSPIITMGHITSLNDEIDSKRFILSSAQISFGSSGGALFRGDTYELIGVPSRVALQGWGQVANYMGYSVPIDRIYEWLESEKLAFFYDAQTTPRQCMEARKDLARRAQLKRVKKEIE